MGFILSLSQIFIRLNAAQNSEMKHLPVWPIYSRIVVTSIRSVIVMEIGHLIILLKRSDVVIFQVWDIAVFLFFT